MPVVRCDRVSLSLMINPLFVYKPSNLKSVIELENINTGGVNYLKENYKNYLSS